jgi:arsenite methyltransferase
VAVSVCGSEPVVVDVVQLLEIGVDISSAVDVAAARFAERRLPGAFLQADITEPPFASGSIDVIFSEGVLHHTDSTETALQRLADLLAPGGRFLFYVYRRKGPIREFTDDYVRERIGALDPEDAWQAIMPITRLGKALGELDAEVEVEEPIEFLGLPAGRINVQRLFYWHVLKAFYRPDLTPTLLLPWGVPDRARDGRHDRPSAS